MSYDLLKLLGCQQKARSGAGGQSSGVTSVQAAINERFGILIFVGCTLLAEPAHASNWLSMCVTKGNSAPVQIKNARTGDRLAPLNSGDLVYQTSSDRTSSDRSPTLAFRDGKFTEIVPRMKVLEKRNLVDCVEHQPKNAEYPIIVREGSSDFQLIYDAFGIIPDEYGVKLGKHFRCPISTDTIVSGWKYRELKSNKIPFVRFCAAMSNNSWFWFDPETGEGRAYYQPGSGGELSMAQFFFKPIPCFLAAKTRINQSAREIRPEGCVFRYNPLTGKPISEEEGLALAKLAVFSFGNGEKGGTLDDTEGLSKQSARRLSSVKIKSIKGD